MKITDNAREFLKEILKEEDGKMLRLYFAGYG